MAKYVTLNLAYCTTQSSGLTSFAALQARARITGAIVCACSWIDRTKARVACDGTGGGTVHCFNRIEQPRQRRPRGRSVRKDRRHTYFGWLDSNNIKAGK